MKSMQINLLPAGDRALVADFGNVIEEQVNNRVHSLRRWLEQQQIPGIRELLPTFRSLMVVYDPAVISYDVLCGRIRSFGDGDTATAETGREILEIPCCYGGDRGPDLPGLSDLTGLSGEEIIRIHSGTVYKIYMLGFLPGFVYLGGLDPRIAAPRLTTPRTVIPAGSVGIGGSQTGVYPIASPGGWRLIGSTPVPFYDPGAAEPILCRAGQYIRFIPTGPDACEEIAARVREGKYQVKIVHESGKVI